MGFSLTKAANGRYKVVLDECWEVERPEVKIPDRHWYEQIPCKGGAFICLYSENPITLKLSTSRVKNARIIFEQINDRLGVRGDFHFDGEAEIFFPPELLSLVAVMAGARKKRRLSPEARTRLAEMGKASQFKGKNHGVESEKTAQI